MISKKELIEDTKYARKKYFEEKYYNILRDMHQAALKGRDYLIIENILLTEEFVEWLLKEEFSVYKKSHLYEHKWLPVINKKEQFFQNDTILISWGEENDT